MDKGLPRSCGAPGALAALQAPQRPVLPSPALGQVSPGAWKYQGGDTFLETVPPNWRYADLVFSLAEKVDGAVSIKFQLPGEDLDPDGLISISDDADIQVRRWTQAAAALGRSRLPLFSSFLQPSSSNTPLRQQGATAPHGAHVL